MKLTFVNVGYGEAILIECPDSSRKNGTFVMLIDGGSAETSEFEDRSSGRVPIEEYVSKRGLDHIDLMVSTHTHEDHICGLLQVAKRLPPAELWQTLPVEFYRSEMRMLDASVAQSASQSKFMRAINDYQALCGSVETHGGTVRTVLAGASGEVCPGLKFQVFAPDKNKQAALIEGYRAIFSQTETEAFLQKLSSLDGRMNNFSLILLLEYQGQKILLPGDTNYLGYDGIDPSALKADLFKIGHHGQKDGVDLSLLKAVQPTMVVCCASSDHRYNSAPLEMMKMVEDTGATLFFSDCPRADIIPHQELVFTIDSHGIRGEYRASLGA